MGDRRVPGGRTGPSWSSLYVITLLGLALFGMVDVDTVTGVARTILEVLAAVVIFGAIAAWARSNRVALELDRRRHAVIVRHAMEAVAEPQRRPSSTGGAGRGGRRGSPRRRRRWRGPSGGPPCAVTHAEKGMR